MFLDLSEFLRRFCVTARYGDLSRAPLELLRMEIRGQRAECEWIARVSDKWDAELPRAVGQQNASMQALRDAMAVRELLFRVLPQMQSAVLRIYRRNAWNERELIITGETTRADVAPSSVKSVVMQAKLLGLRFEMREGVLEDLQREFAARV